MRAVILVLMLMLVQFASAGVPGYDDKYPMGYRFIAGYNNAYAEIWPAWLRECDSLNRILSGPLAAGDVSNRCQPAYANWLEYAGEEAVSDFIGGYFFIDANALYTFRDPSIRLYQAYESITFDIGFETAVGDEFTAEIIPLGSQVPAPSNNTGSANSDMNWVLAKSFDENGNVIGESKQFFDNSGRLLQSQTKAKYRKNATTAYTHVFASQPVRDAHGRDAMATMSAPIDNSEFIYKPDFVRNSSGGNYDYKNFDRFNPAGIETDKTNNPDPVGGQNVPGTLGWYYSANNTWEPYTPTTEFPYNRKTFYDDGTATAKRIGGLGEAYKMGSGHEISNTVTPVLNELDHYIQIRNKFFSSSEMGELPGELKNGAIQLISTDPNGRLSIIIKDRGGRTLMTARPGSELRISNLAKVPDGELFFFKTFASSTVTLSSAVNLINRETGETINIGTSGTVAAGNYKIENTSLTDLFVTYSNSYSEVSYSFYNQLGQMVAAIAPEGVKKLFGSGLNSYGTKTDIPFISFVEYDVQGRPVKNSTTDGGAAELVYRKDGKLRFSQNAVQKANNRYSYTNYDQFGRPVESGEYDAGTNGIAFNSDLTVATNPMRDILEDISVTGGLINGTKKDVIMTLYDVVDQNPGVGTYSQNAEYLGGAVSMTKKYSSIVNNTPSSADIVSSNWYNYNEEGKVVWCVQYIKGLGYKTTDYSYDVQGRLIKKDYQKGATGTERFIHYYEYDAVTQKLWKVRTSVDDITKILQATYVYYLHGPLKRIELATDLQGIDYTYTLQGALKAINNSDKTKDPGGDGGTAFSTDAFGMVLDYFPGDYKNSRTTGIQPLQGVNTTAIGADSYSGTIKAMTWFSKKPASAVGSNPAIEDPATYIYQYDDKYQFTESTWGTGINFGNIPATFAQTGFNKETVKNPANGLPAYDANGNILYLQRTDAAGAISENFTYNYLPNTNKLQSVVHNASSTPENYASYTYDQKGQLTGETNTFKGINQSKYIEYNVSGKVVAVYRDGLKSQKVVEYVYDETGNRIIKRSYSGGQPLQITYYVGSVIYTQLVTNGTPGAITPLEYEISGGGGRLGTFYRQIPVYAYEMTDHLGNVRAVVAKSASTMEVRMYTDYYPYGGTIGGNPTDYRHGYQGQYAEKDGETDWSAFELRMYDSKIARWLSVDPKKQFSSPYIGMGNDPVNGVDKDGGFWQELKNWTLGRGWMSNAAYNYVKSLEGQGYEVQSEWVGSRLKGHLNVSWNSNETGWVRLNDDTWSFMIDNPTGHGRSFNAIQDYFVTTKSGQVYAMYLDLELKVNAGLQFAAQLPFNIAKIDLNIISYDLAKYSFVDRQLYHVFDKKDNMTNLKFSSEIGMGLIGFGGSLGGEYAPKQGFELSAVATNFGIDVELTKNLMQKEAGAVMGFGLSAKEALIVGIESKMYLKNELIPNNDINGWLKR